jgi:hypothetical protein
VQISTLNQCRTTKKTQPSEKLLAKTHVESEQ